MTPSAIEKEPTTADSGLVGWQSRDWAKSTEREQLGRSRELLGRYRSLLWLAATVVALFGASRVLDALHQTHGSYTVHGSYTHPVVYGWWNVPPPGVDNSQPSIQGNRNMICVIRAPDASAYGGFVCGGYVEEVVP